MEQRPKDSDLEALTDQHRQSAALDGTRRRWRRGMDGLLGRSLNPVVVLAAASFVLHQIAIHLDFRVVWADSYLDPLCTVPVALGIPSMLARRIRPNFALRWWSVASFTSVLSVVFEWWIPNFDTRFTADALDVLAFATGAMIWRFVEPQGY